MRRESLDRFAMLHDFPWCVMCYLMTDITVAGIRVDARAVHQC
jgi:hypothetical protein